MGKRILTTMVIALLSLGLGTGFGLSLGATYERQMNKPDNQAQVSLDENETTNTLTPTYGEDSEAVVALIQNQTEEDIQEPDIQEPGQALIQKEDVLPVALTQNGSLDGLFSASDLFRKVEKSVVSINVTASGGWLGQTYTSAGSGIVFSKTSDKIYIITNYHVINGGKKVSVSFDDSYQIPASYVGGVSQSDLAVISILVSDLNMDPSLVVPAQFTDSDKIMVGDWVMAVGNALGEGKSATLGIVSALNKEITVESGAVLTTLQTDAAINPGNSGGALVNLSGQVVGVNTAKLSQSGVEGMGYAIPANEAKSIAQQIIETGRVYKPFMGVETVDVDETVQKAYNLPAQGVYVNRVYQGGTADVGGIIRGDIIIEMNGQKITKGADLTECLKATKVGDKSTVKIVRVQRGQVVTLDIEVVIQNYSDGTDF